MIQVEYSAISDNRILFRISATTYIYVSPVRVDINYQF